MEKKNNTPTQETTITVRGRQFSGDTENKCLVDSSGKLTLEGLLNTDEIEISIPKDTMDNMKSIIRKEIGDSDRPSHLFIRNDMKSTMSIYSINGSDIAMTAVIHREIEDNGDKFQNMKFVYKRRHETDHLTSYAFTSYVFTINDGKFTVFLRISDHLLNAMDAEFICHVQDLPNPTDMRNMRLKHTTR